MLSSLRNVRLCSRALRVSLAPSSTVNLHSSNNDRTKALAVWENLGALKRSPMPALTLGLSGLIPFVASPLLMIQQGMFLPGLATAQIAYGATILSFLGGVRWGILIVPTSEINPTWMQYCWAVTPSLVAWSALLMPPVAGTLTCVGGLGLAGYLDLIQYGYPPWFKGLRFLLTSVAILSLWSSLMCKLLLSEKEAADPKGELRGKA